MSATVDMIAEKQSGTISQTGKIPSYFFYFVTIKLFSNGFFINIILDSTSSIVVMLVDEQQPYEPKEQGTSKQKEVQKPAGAMEKKKVQYICECGYNASGKKAVSDYTRKSTARCTRHQHQKLPVHFVKKNSPTTA